MTELKPCGYCGGDKVKFYEDYNSANDKYIQCTNCLIKTDGYRFPEHAIEAWNNRPAIEAMQKREVALTQTIKEFVNMMEEILQEDTKECAMINSEANGLFLHRTESIVNSPQYQALKSTKE